MRLKSLRWFPVDIPEQIDIDDVHRARQIQEASVQQRADAECRILRVTGHSVGMQRRQIPAIIERGRA